MPVPTVLYDTSALYDAREDAGIGRYTAGLLAALRARDDVHVLTTPPLPRPRNESRPFRWIRAQPAVTRAWRGSGAALLHSTTGDPALTVAARRQVCTVHDAYLWTASLPEGRRGTALRGFREVMARRLRACAAVVTTSQPTADDVIAALRLDRSRVHVVPLGVDARFRPSPGPDDAAHLGALALQGGGYVLFTGNLRHHDPRKGLDVLLEAVHRLNGGAPALVLAGATGEESARLANVGRRLHVDVRVTGRVDDDVLAALYRHAAAFAMPSRYEGFGLSVLEAMASGTPVVATDGGNLPHLTAGAALLVPVDQPAAMSVALATALHDNEARDRLRRDGVARAAAFTWDACARATVDVYQQVVSTL